MNKYEVVCYNPEDNSISFVGMNDTFDGVLESKTKYSLHSLLCKKFKLTKYDKKLKMAYFTDKNKTLKVLVKQYIPDMNKIINS